MVSVHEAGRLPAVGRPRSDHMVESIVIVAEPRALRACASETSGYRGFPGELGVLPRESTRGGGADVSARRR